MRVESALIGICYRLGARQWEMTEVEEWCGWVSWLQVAAGNMQVWERANILLGEARGTSRQGEVLLCPICRTGILNSSKRDHAEKDYRVDQGKWESVSQEEVQSAQLV